MAFATVSALTPFPPARQTEPAGFLHLALVQGHGCAHGKLGFRTPRRVKPQSAHSVSSGKRRNFPAFALRS